MDARAIAGTLGRNSALRYEHDADRQPGNYIRVSRGSALRGGLLARRVADRAEIALALDPLTADRDDIVQVVRDLAELARSDPLLSVELHAPGLLTRYEARRAGFVGGLRVPLVSDGAAPDALPEIDAAGLAVAVAQLVPTAQVHAGRAPRAFGRLARGARAGFDSMAKLVVTPSRAPAFEVAVPIRADVMPEPLALAIDTTISVVAVFGHHVDFLRMVSFDHAEHGLVAGRVSGMANANAAIIHLNASFALADELVPLMRKRAVKPARRPSGTPIEPFTHIDGTTAHELWHQMEAAFEARRYVDSIQFRRDLGGYFGVDTLEQVTNGGHRNASAAHRLAFERLNYEVSPYATTNPREATAEMFKCWWCTTGEPTAIVALFGDLLERFFGVPRLPREREP